ncbi:hypothetical protein FACS189459_1840 [Bacilli bacterium]|nr:hypothetical protein FACS189459_1840 [Bacilli bacterium]
MLIGTIQKEDIEIAKTNDIIVPITSLEQANILANENIEGLRIQYKINTGMNRMGFNNKNDISEAYKIMTNKKVVTMGVYSHIYDN